MPQAAAAPWVMEAPMRGSPDFNLNKSWPSVSSTWPSLTGHLHLTLWLTSGELGLLEKKTYCKRTLGQVARYWTGAWGPVFYAFLASNHGELPLWASVFLLGKIRKYYLTRVSPCLLEVKQLFTMKSYRKPQCRKWKCRGIRLSLTLGKPGFAHAAPELFHTTLGFCRRQLEDASNNILGHKNSKNLKLPDHLQLINTMTQAKGTLL